MFVERRSCFGMPIRGDRSLIEKPTADRNLAQGRLTLSGNSMALCLTSSPKATADLPERRGASMQRAESLLGTYIAECFLIWCRIALLSDSAGRQPCCTSPGSTRSVQTPEHTVPHKRFRFTLRGLRGMNRMETFCRPL